MDRLVRSYSATFVAEIRINSAGTARSVQDDSVSSSAAAACRAWDQCRPAGEQSLRLSGIRADVDGQA